MSESLLFTRREFLRTAGIVAATTAAMPAFLARTAAATAAPAPIKGFTDGRILVVIQLGGGNDGLNTVVPFTDDAYRRARPRLALEADNLLRIDDSVALNGRLKGLKQLYDQGLVAVVEGVGYPNPNRSHFRSTEIWQTATDSDKYSRTGWIGRYFDACCNGEAEPVAGVAIGGERPQAFGGERGLGVAFQDPHSFGWAEGAGAAREQHFRVIAGATRPQNETLDFLRKVAADAVISADRVRDVARRHRGSTAYPPDQFGQSLQTVARMIAGGLATKIYYVSLTGFDTHANQRGTHDGLLERLGSGVAAFHADLRQQGNADRTLIMTFSEFGRRVAENGSGGTDHGTAAPMFLIGDRIRPGFAGRRPSLTDLDNGDLRHTTDFRAVYAAVLNQWLAAKPADVLGRDFEPIPILRA